MYRKIRITVVALVAVMLCVLSSSGTLSYFTDSDVKTNEFLVGNASTELKIYDAPALGDEDLFTASDYILVDEMKVPLYLQATNDGNIPVYQRFRVVVPIELAEKVTMEFPVGTCEVTAQNQCNNADYAVIYNPSVEVDNTPTYAEYYIVNNTAMNVGATTQNVPAMTLKTDGITDEDKDSFVCENGDANECKVWINIYSDAIQVAGFTNGAVEAFENFTESYNN